MEKIKNVWSLAVFMAAMSMFVSCDKVSPTGVLVGGSGVDDRVDMSYTYYLKYMQDSIDMETPTASDGEYSFLVGTDSHVASDPGRINEMIDDGLEHGDLLWASLGDIADTNASNYITLKKALEDGQIKYLAKYFEYRNVENVPFYYDKRYSNDEEPNFKHTYSAYRPDDIPFPFYSVVGNHDITRNGWALFSSIFHSSFFHFTVKIGKTDEYDHFVFLDTANGTLGEKQIELLNNDVFKTDKKIRHTFVFSHTNLFRPSYMQFSSTFPREELYYLLHKFSEWNATIVFCGHVHKWDDREVGGVRYLTLESMSERNSPIPGDYLVRITCKKDGTVDMQRVHMNYVKK